MTNIFDAKKKQESRSGLLLRLGQSCLATLVFLSITLGGAFAQDAGEGIDNGNYHYQGSFELG